MPIAHLSSTTLAVLDDLHDQLCRDVPLVGGEFKLCGAQINALRAGLPRLLANEQHITIAAHLAQCEEATRGCFTPALSAFAYDEAGARMQRPWWRRLGRWWRRQIDSLGDVCDE